MVVLILSLISSRPNRLANLKSKSLSFTIGNIVKAIVKIEEGGKRNNADGPPRHLAKHPSHFTASNPVDSKETDRSKDDQNEAQGSRLIH